MSGARAGVWIWSGALVLYALFALWYHNLRGPLRADEIEGFVARLEERSDVDPARVAGLRAFLEADDGGEFFMVNLLATPAEPVPLPGSGERRPAREVLARYTDHFMPALLARAGHPAFVGFAAGGYVEAWGVEPNPGWTAAGVIRYRSRRDLIELATDPAFEPAHVYKLAALDHTLAFPAAPGGVLLGPRVGVALGLALGAALLHLGTLSRRRAPAGAKEAA